MKTVGNYLINFLVIHRDYKGENLLDIEIRLNNISEDEVWLMNLIDFIAHNLDNDLNIFFYLYNGFSILIEKL